MKHPFRAELLFLLVTMASCNFAVSQSFQYDLRVVEVVETDKTLTVDAFVKVDGEPHTKVRLGTSPGTLVRKVFDSEGATGDLEYSYFRIQTKEEIPPASPLRQRPRLDILTREVMSDLTLNETYRQKSTAHAPWDGDLNPFPLQDENILSIKKITQNEFLGIQPKIVTPHPK